MFSISTPLIPWAATIGLQSGWSPADSRGAALPSSAEGQH